MGTINKRLSKLTLDALCDKYKSGSALLLDCYNQIVYNDSTPTITTRTNAANHIYMMFIYEADSNTAD